MLQVEVRGLHKHYRVHRRESGALSSLRSLFRREYRLVRAVDGVDFGIEPGEVVGFLGPNGAGKTTTLKVLAGLLHPTAGEVSVLGYRPQDRRAGFLRQMTLVMGQKQQLYWDLPALDTFELNREVYGLDPAAYRTTLAELDELLELGDLVRQPVRRLSLGERMKCELTAALLHRPGVLFLDEPTIGLDVTMQARIRAFIAEYNRRTGATVLLTSHYMADVTALCRRVLIIDHGRQLYDGDLAELGRRLAPYKLVRVQLDHGVPPGTVERYGAVMEVEQDGLRFALRVEREGVAEVAAALLRELSVADVTVEDPSAEEVVRQVFEGGLADADAPSRSGYP